jgi:uncharacterized membrane protein YhaH (DUF805 family)
MVDNQELFGPRGIADPLPATGSAPSISRNINLAPSFDIFPSIPQLFTFRGRVNRRVYLISQIVVWSALAVFLATMEGIFSHGIDELLTIDTPLVRGHSRPDLVLLFDNIGGGDPIRIMVAVVCIVITYIMALSVTFRRWHDFGYGGGTVIILNLLSAIPYLGVIFGLIMLAAFFYPGDRHSNQYGDPPGPMPALFRFRQVPDRIWRGEVPLGNLLFYYVFILDFILLDKAGTTLMAGLDLSTLNLLYVGALIIFNILLSVGVWRSATLSSSGSIAQVFGRFVSAILMLRALFTLGGLLLAGT